MRKVFLSLLALNSLLIGASASEFSEQVKVITIEDYDSEVLEHKGLVVVDLYAEWCPPCHRMKPIISSLAEQYGQGVKFVAINVDRSRDLRKRFNLRCIPTFLFLKDGKVLEQQNGSISQKDLEGKLISYSSDE